MLLVLIDVGGIDVKDFKVINMDVVSVDQFKVLIDLDFDVFFCDKELMIDFYNEDEVFCFIVFGKVNKIYYYLMQIDKN